MGKKRLESLRSRPSGKISTKLQKVQQKPQKSKETYDVNSPLSKRSVRSKRSNLMIEKNVESSQCNPRSNNFQKLNMNPPYSTDTNSKYIQQYYANDTNSPLSKMTFHRYEKDHQMMEENIEASQPNPLSNGFFKTIPDTPYSYNSDSEIQQDYPNDYQSNDYINPALNSNQTPLPSPISSRPMKIKRMINIPVNPKQGKKQAFIKYFKNMSPEYFNDFDEFSIGRFRFRHSEKKENETPGHYKNFTKILRTLIHSYVKEPKNKIQIIEFLNSKSSKLKIKKLYTRNWSPPTYEDFKSWVNENKTINFVNLEGCRRVWGYADIDTYQNLHIREKHFRYVLTEISNYCMKYEFLHSIFLKVSNVNKGNNGKILKKNADCYIDFYPVFMRGLQNPATLFNIKQFEK